MKKFTICLFAALIFSWIILPEFQNGKNVLMADNFGKIKNKKPNYFNLAFKGCDVAAKAGSKFTRRLNDGDTTAESEVTVMELPATFHLLFPKQTRVDAIRIYPGNVQYVNNPSGECSPVDYTVEGLSSASGMWRELIRVNGAPGSKKLKVNSNAEYFFDHNFNPLDITELRVVVTDSSDTKHRASGVKVDRKGVIIREIEAYNTKDVAAKRPKNFLGKIVQGDYRLAIYRNTPTAELYLICSDKVKTPLDVKLSFIERHTKKKPANPMLVKLETGQNIIPIDIKHWPNGEYRTSIKAVTKDKSVIGEFGRLLRIDNLAPPTPPAGVTTMAGEKMYFPDKWYLENEKNVKFQSFSAQTYQATSSNPKKFVNIGTDIFFADDNKIVIPFYSKTRDWNAASIESHYTTANLDDLNNWTVSDQLNVKRITKRKRVYTSLTPFEEAIPDWKPAEGQKIKYTFYDKTKDGPVPLNRVFMLYSHKPREMGVAYAPPQSTWVAWKKSANEIVLLKKEAFLQDNISAGEFESLTDSNDNFAGLWMSKDGKTLHYARGHLVRRFPPFIARYDNLWQIARMLTIFSTTDGFNWKRHYFGLPTKADPFGSQHYGAGIVRVPNSNGMMLSFTYNYDVMGQKIAAEVYYSWDGGEIWQRFPGQPMLVPTGPEGSWLSGSIMLYKKAIEKDGKVYHLIGWGFCGSHFTAEISYNPERMAKLDGAYLKKMYGERDLESWPYFKHYGSWEKLADSIKDSFIATGLAVYRKDGLFGLVAKDGSFTTRAITASGKMYANANIGQGGEIKLTLVDTNGKELAGYTAMLTGDNVKIPVEFANGKNLPSVPFKIKASIKKATLFTFNFEK